MSEELPPKACVRIKVAKLDEQASGERTYEIEPQDYAGPWRLPVGTVLQVVRYGRDHE